MRSVIQANPSYELSVDIANTAHGHTLKFVSYVSTARRPEQQVQYQTLLSTAELSALRDAINQALEVEKTGSRSEPVTHASQ